MYVCTMWVPGTCGGQKKMLDPLKFTGVTNDHELSCGSWGPGPFARAPSALNHRLIFPAFIFIYFF